MGHGHDVDRELAAARLRRRLFDAPFEPVRVGRYTLLERVGRGGMAVVYAAYDESLARKVAIKFIDERRAASPPWRRRMVREAQAMAQVSHTNVAHVYEVGEHAEQTFIAMEFIDGPTLRGWLAAQPRSTAAVMEMFTAVGRGLAAAHEAGVVHRDFKPENVLVAPTGEPKVVDFGLAALRDPIEPDPVSQTTDPEGGPALTATGAVMGTPLYMAPEQYAGRTDARSDQFSFCVALYDALYGRRPFAGSTLEELAESVKGGELRPPPAGSAVPRGVGAAIARGLAPDPERRWPSMLALVDELDRRGRRRSRAAPLLAVAFAGVVSLAIWVDRQTTIAACNDAAAEYDDVWNDKRRAAVRRGLLGTGATHAEPTFEKVVPWLDRQADAWREARSEACLATELRRDWDAALRDRALWCLDERRMQFDALVSELEHADVDALTRAVDAAADLHRVDPCRDAAALHRLPPPPSEGADQIPHVRASLSAVAALQATGAYDDALALARQTKAQADAIGWPLLVSAAGIQLGRALAATGAYADAAEALEAAYFEAARAGAVEEAYRAADQLVQTVGQDLLHPDEALRWSRHAEALQTALPDPAGLHRAALLTNRANVLDATGSHTEAVGLHEEVLAIREQALGADHPLVASTLNNLAIAQRGAGEYGEAARLYERALAIRERVSGPDHPLAAVVVHNLANLEGAAGDYAEAIRLHQRALQIRERTLGPDHPATASSLTNLANARLDKGEYREAVRHLERALAIRERVLDPNHLDLAFTLNSLGNGYNDLGEHRAAVEAHTRALKIFEAAQGMEHEDVAMSLTNLGAVYQAKGEFAEAAKFHERALGIIERARGPEHRDVAVSLNNLANAREALGAHAEAVGLHERALGIRERALGPDHPELASSLVNLANARRRVGSYEGAAQLYERALAIMERAHGPKHRHVAIVLSNLARARGAMGEHAEARRLYERAVNIVEETFGPEHPEVAHRLSSFGIFCQTMGWHADAVKLHARALRITEKAVEADHPDIALALHNLAGAQYAANELDDAARSYARMLDIRERRLGPDDPAVATPLIGLAEIDLTRGRRREAITQAERALALRAAGEGSAVALAEARFVLARALVRKDRRRALTLAQQARNTYADAAETQRDALAEVEAWLTRRGGASRRASDSESRSP